MDHEFPLFNDLLILLAASIPIAFVFNRLRLPVIVGFMMAGVLIGPYGLGLIREVAAIDMLAELGVVLLMFTIGLEFSLRRIADLKRLVVWGGGGQVLLTVGAVTALAATVRPFQQALFDGFLITLSSTAIVLKTYMDYGETDTPHGRAGIGILLFQDVCIVPMMLLVPILSGREGASPLRIAATLGSAAVAVVVIVVAARYIVPFLLHYVVRLRSSEVFVLFVVLVALGTSWLTAHFGLSLALGAFVAGLVLSESEYSHQIVADILPFRDVFNSIFFVSIGMLLSVGALVENAGTVLGVVVGLVVLKTVIAAAVVRVLGYPPRVAVMTGLGLAQVGEFSFILAKAGSAQGLLDGADSQIFLAASIVSMIATPFLIKAAPRVGLALQERLSPGSLLEPSIADFPSREVVRDHVVVVGYGLNGRNVARVLRGIDIRYRIVELNAESVREARTEGEPILFGDSTREEVLRRAGVDTARILVVTVADPIAARHAVHLARRLNPHIRTIVRTRYMSELEDLYRLGADEVIPEEFETSLEISARVLAAYGVSRLRIRRRKDVLRREGYRALRAHGAPETEVGSLAELLEATTTETVPIDDGSPGAGRTIGGLDLRKTTGATVVAVNRRGDAEINPSPEFELAAGDSVVLLGSPEQVDAAVEVLAGAGATV
jgi:CPA2 family monovalent cation:H+ antiporter-2